MQKNSFFLSLFILFHVSLFAIQVITIAKKFWEINPSFSHTKLKAANQINHSKNTVNSKLQADLNTASLDNRCTQEKNNVRKAIDRSSDIKLIHFYQIRAYESGRLIPGQSVLGN